MRHPILWAMLATLAGGLPSVSYGQTAAFDRESILPVVHYQEVIAKLAADDPGPSVAVYGDGRVVVQFPSYMKRAGTYALQLDPEELDRLFESLLSDGIADFDATAVREAQRGASVAMDQRRRQSPRASAEMHVRTDATIAIIVARLAQATERRGGASHRIRWSGLRADAEVYPEVPALARLATAEQRLRSLMERRDLQRLD